MSRPDAYFGPAVIEVIIESFQVTFRRNHCAG